MLVCEVVSGVGIRGVLIVTVVVPVIYGGKEGGRVAGLYAVSYKNRQNIQDIFTSGQKTGYLGRMDVKEGKTGGYLTLNSFRKKECEMEKNQGWDAQQRPFC